MAASISELIALAERQAPRNRLADLAASGVEGYLSGRAGRGEAERKALERQKLLVEIDKTLNEVELQKDQIEMNKNYMKAMGMMPKTEEENTAAASTALDSMGPAQPTYGGNRKTPITKTERVSAVTQPVQQSDAYDTTATFKDGKWGLTIEPKSKRKARDQFDLDYLEARTDAQKALADQRRRTTSTGGGKGAGSNPAVLAEKERKFARDMAIREEVSRQKASGQYFPETFKYEPTEDELLKYLPIAKQYLSGNSGEATKQTKEAIDKTDFLNLLSNPQPQ